MADDPQPTAPDAASTSDSAHFETLAIRTQAPITQEREHSVPLYLTSSFRFDDAEHARALFAEEVPGNIYSRYSNPNTDEFVRKLCLLEGAEDGIATASGMSAVFTALASRLSAGDHVVSSRALFGSTHQIFTRILPKWGVSTTYVDGPDQAAWEATIRPETKVLFIETPSNPGLELIDLAWLGELARARNIPLLAIEWLRRMPSSFAPRRSIARRLWWLKKCVRNSTAMQSSASKAWPSRRSLQSVLRGPR